MAEAVDFETPTSTMYAAQGCYFQLDLVTWTKPLNMHMVHICPEGQLLIPTIMSFSAAGEQLVQAQTELLI